MIGVYFKVSCFSLIVQELFLHQDLCPGTFSKNQYASFLDYCPPCLMLKPMVIQRRLKGLKWCKSIENWSIVKKITEKNVFETFKSVFHTTGLICTLGQALTLGCVHTIGIVCTLDHIHIICLVQTMGYIQIMGLENVTSMSTK